MSSKSISARRGAPRDLISMSSGRAPARARRGWGRYCCHGSVPGKAAAQMFTPTKAAPRAYCSLTIGSLYASSSSSFVIPSPKVPFFGAGTGSSELTCGRGQHLRAHSLALAQRAWMRSPRQELAQRTRGRCAIANGWLIARRWLARSLVLPRRARGKAVVRRKSSRPRMKYTKM